MRTTTKSAGVPRGAVSSAQLGAYGYLELTHDLTRFTSLPLYERVGMRMKVFVPFRRKAPIFLVAAGDDSPRISGTRRQPLDDPWDHFSLLSTALAVYGLQTDRWIRGEGAATWVKKEFRIVNPIAHPPLTHERTPRQIAARFFLDISGAIERGEFPAWKVSVQVVPVSEAEARGWLPFKAHARWPFAAAPMHPLGTLVLDRNAGKARRRSASVPRPDEPPAPLLRTG